MVYKLGSRIGAPAPRIMDSLPQNDWDSLSRLVSSYNFWEDEFSAIAHGMSAREDEFAPGGRCVILLPLWAHAIRGHLSSILVSDASTVTETSSNTP